MESLKAQKFTRSAVFLARWCSIWNSPDLLLIPADLVHLPGQTWPARIVSHAFCWYPALFLFIGNTKLGSILDLRWCTLLSTLGSRQARNLPRIQNWHLPMLDSEHLEEHCLKRSHTFWQKPPPQTSCCNTHGVCCSPCRRGVHRHLKISKFVLETFESEHPADLLTGKKCNLITVVKSHPND